VSDPRRLSVLLLINSLERAGAEKVVANLAATMDRSRFDLTVATIWPVGELKEEIVSAGTGVYSLCARGDSILRAVIPLRQLLRRNHVDILHSQLGAAGLLARLTAMTCRELGTIHTEQAIADAYSLFGRILNCATQWLPDMVIAPSSDVHASWNICPLTRARRTAVIPNGIHIPVWPSQSGARQHWRSLFAAGDDELVVGTIGYCYERKGQRFLLEASRDLLERHRARLIIVGEGPLKPQLQQLARAYGMDDRVTFTGAQRDIGGILESFDVFVLPSVAEGMPIVLLEAMAREVPSVATTVGGNSDVIHDGESGLLVPPKAVSPLHDAIDELLSSPQLRSQIGASGRSRIIAEFSVERMSRDYGLVYERVAAYHSDMPKQSLN